MSISDQASLYDKEYYHSGCGVPYERSEHWLSFFGHIADMIVQNIGPASVLDAGCAWGFLVENLRNRGVEAYGVDISEYAISQVAEPIKPYCWVGSLVEPLPRRYDLIVTIEVLEHIPQDDLPAAIKTLCDASDDIIFSSTPDDYNEATHFSVQPPEKWASMFAVHDFWHDVDFDASFITPWAMRFRKRKDPVYRTVVPMERKLWELKRENTSLRLSIAREQAHAASSAHEALTARITELEAALDAARTEHQLPEMYWNLLGQAFDIAKADNLLDALQAELAETHAQRNALEKELTTAALELSSLQYKWTTTQSRMSYRVLNKTLRSMETLAPEGGVRRSAMRTTLLAIKRISRIGRGGRSRQKQIPADTQIPLKDLPFPVLAALNKPSLTYPEWYRQTTPSQGELELMTGQIESFTYQPTISLLTPVFNPPINALRDALESARTQIYPNWELCVVDGGDSRPVRELLKAYAQLDARIKVKKLARNLGISGNSNAAAELATGEFIQIFDHDDALEPHALFEVVKALNADQTIDVIYFDEDKLSADGVRREDPFFKPDWSPAMFLSANYLTHCVIRRSLYNDVGGCDTATDGTQDWDLLLKITERTQRVHHIPQILYHWRKAPGSAAGAHAAKPYVFERQLIALKNHLERQGISQPTVEFAPTGHIRVQWPVKDDLVSIIIPTKDKIELLKVCLDSVFERTRYRNFEVILVDTGSVEKRTWDYYDTLAKNDQVRIVNYTGQFNYSRANNVGVQHAKGSIFLFLNNDTEVIEPDWLEELMRWAQRSDVGVVGTKLLYPSKHIQHAGVIMGMGGHAGHIFAGMSAHSETIFGSTDWYRNYMAITGACMMTRKDVFDKIGGFDEEYLIAFSDVEYCMRAHNQGFATIYTPFACMYHHESASRGTHIPVRDIRIGFQHMYPIVDAGDPYFNGNLDSGVAVPVPSVNDAPKRSQRLRTIVRQHDPSANGR